MQPRLTLDPAAVAAARELARRAGQPIVDMARTHTTVSVERAVLRLAGLRGADADGMPWVNRLADAVRESVGLEHGVALPVFDAMLEGGHPDLASLAVAAARGTTLFAYPLGNQGAGRPRRRGRRADGGHRPHRRPAGRARAADRPDRAAAHAVDLPDRGHRRHPRGHPAGPGRGAGGRRRHRGDQVHRAVAAGLRARGGDQGGLRGHLRDPGELPADAGRAGRGVLRAGPLRPADQLRLGPVHARDRGAGRPGAAGHDAERLHVRDHLPRHQPPPDVHRPAVLPADPRPRRDHHQHRRGQLPDHRRRRGRRAHRGGQPAAERVLRPRGRAGRRPARAGPRVRDRPGGAGLVRARAGPRPADPRAVPRRAAQVHAAHQAHDRQRVRRLPARRVLQPGRADDRPVHPAHRHDDRGHPHAVPGRPGPGPGERPLRPAGRGPAGRELPPRARRVRRPARSAGAGRGGGPAAPDRRRGAAGPPSPDGTFGITQRPADGGRGLDGVIARAADYFNPAADLLERDQP